jgi:hypothetical protein
MRPALPREGLPSRWNHPERVNHPGSRAEEDQHPDGHHEAHFLERGRLANPKSFVNPPEFNGMKVPMN